MSTQENPRPAFTEAPGSAGRVDMAISRLKEEIRTVVQWQVRSETGGVVIGFDNKWDADDWLADHNKRFPDSVHGKCSVVRYEWMPHRAEDLREVIGELLRLRVEVALHEFKAVHPRQEVRQNDKPSGRSETN